MMTNTFWYMTEYLNNIDKIIIMLSLHLVYQTKDLTVLGDWRRGKCEKVRVWGTGHGNNAKTISFKFNNQ